MRRRSSGDGLVEASTTGGGDGVAIPTTTKSGVRFAALKTGDGSYTGGAQRQTTVRFATTPGFALTSKDTDAYNKNLARRTLVRRTWGARAFERLADAVSITALYCQLIATAHTPLTNPRLRVCAPPPLLPPVRPKDCCVP